MTASVTTVDDLAVRHAEFAAELLRRRMIAGLSQGALAGLMGYDRTYVNKAERGAVEPTAEFARKADETLEARGELIRRWDAFNEAKGHQHASVLRRSTSADETAADVLVEEDEAWLAYKPGTYSLRMRKRITNVGEAPVTRFFIRVAVDRFPNDPRSNDWHRRHPLTLDELDLAASCNDEPMAFEVKQDRDATKEFWLLFHNDRAQFPLYPGQEATLEYSYGVGAEKWGQWFQRAVRLPTRWLGVHLAFPATLEPSAWGVEVAPAAGERPFHAPVQREEEADQVLFHWSTVRPPLAARYRLEWSFRAGSTA